MKRKGSRQWDALWNHPGTALVYTAASQTLATLEVLANLDPEDAPPEFALLCATIPDEVAVEVVAVASRPPSWSTYPGPEALRNLGDAWTRRPETCVLSIPSAIVPRE